MKREEGRGKGAGVSVQPMGERGEILLSKLSPTVA